MPHTPSTPREILEEVKRRIVAEPEKYNQDSFCGTACCIAGHICAVTGALGPEGWVAPINAKRIDSIDRSASESLGEYESPWLFGEINTDREYDEDERGPEYWPSDLSCDYVAAKTPLGKAAVGCKAIDGYLEERGL
jgi:hypothetical protein